MLDQYGSPQQGHPAQPVYAQPQPPHGYPAHPYGYPAQQYGYPVPYTPPLPRPALTRKQRVGAMLAGGIGFTMFSLGAGAAFSIAVFGLVVGIFAIIFGFVGLNNSGQEGFQELQSFLDSFPVGIIVVVAIVAFVLALALMVGGILVSIRIMKKRGVNSPVAATWSGLGIGIVVYWVTSSVVSFVPSMMGSFADGVFGVVLVAFTVLLAIALPIVIGVFTWWWMAHIMRAPAAG